MYLNRFDTGNGMVPGFTTSLKTRPLAISKMISYITERSCVIKSKRTLEELRTFIWKNGKAQAQDGYNDDLVMAFGIGMFLRDTALKFSQAGMNLTRASLGGIGRVSYNTGPNSMYSPHSPQNTNPWQMDDGAGRMEDISWLV